MRRQRPTDGTPTHKRASRYHLTMLAAHGGALHLQLHTEMLPLLATLTEKERAVEDARDASVTCQALEDHHERNFENVLRDIDADLGKLDRADATLNASAQVFPHGYGQVIEPEGDAQLVGVPGLRILVAKFANHAAIADHLNRFDAAVTALTNAVKATNAAEDVVDTLFREETDARSAIRQQFESAYGRLRAFYKATPAKAEQLFLREGTRRSTSSN